MKVVHVAFLSDLILIRCLKMIFSAFRVFNDHFCYWSLIRADVVMSIHNILLFLDVMICRLEHTWQHRLSVCYCYCVGDSCNQLFVVQDSLSHKVWLFHEGPHRRAVYTGPACQPYRSTTLDHQTHQKSVTFICF